MTAWPIALDRLAYGGDYNPEQWPETTWREDVRLMREAGVNLVSVGVFSWALLEPEPGRFDFGWLDRVLDLLHEGGVRVDLATATASPPPWFSRAHPDSLPVTFDGRTLWPGGRQAYCPSSPAYRAAAARLVEQLATRYAGHPALAMWHANNEYGCHVARCYCDVSAAAFRDWLRRRHRDLDALNEAWGTAFWSQHYSRWDEINPPRQAPNFINPTQQLDFARFSSDELLACFRAEREILRRLTPDVPVTTNFMTPAFKPLDYFRWAPEQDVISTDHYLRPAEGDPNLDLALSGDLTRGLAGGAPWLLMEHSTSAVNWQERNLAKRPGQMRRNSLAHVARGSDGALFFQWRASRRGAEKFHSGMVPHAGEDSRMWREVVALGRDLERLAPVRGSRVVAEVAMLWDYESWWAVELDSHPSADVTYLDRVRAFHAALWRAGVTVDVVHPEHEWSGYQLVLVPSLYLVSDATAEALERYVRMGGHAVVSYFSGIVDPDDAIRLGGYPGAFRELLGVRVEEFRPLAAGETVELDDGSVASVWTEDLRLDGARAVMSHLDGRPAVTRHEYGDGVAWYAATRLDPAPLLERVCAEAGVEPVLPGLPAGVEAVRRRGADGDFVFVLNHTAGAVAVPGEDLLGGDGTVPAGGVAVMRG
ncbi:beta-galactosidase [Candidatus Solirubrobacter pratensis]|uniref:beta-galactosidase n=1 Tax=Candidatus Solirubrobacter pratensis TaxID=1298857 RepID=UPI0004249548|nr:beta-galactosidase [Candidatus Solirubrobacter pratensis]